MLNVQQIINGSNKTVLENSIKPTQDQVGRTCNCRKMDECPLEGNSLCKGIVYKAKMTSEIETETYAGLTAMKFKARFRDDLVAFNNETCKNDRAEQTHLAA